MQMEEERDRLNRRASAIAGTELARELRRYRKEINRLDAIKARGVRGFSKPENRGTRWRAEDEVKLCHEFLDNRGIDPMME